MKAMDISAAAIITIGAIWVWQCLQELWVLATSRTLVPRRVA